MDRPAFMARLVKRRDLDIAPAPARPDAIQGDLVEILADRLLAGGCGVHRAQGAEAALATALDILRQAGVDKAGHGGLPEAMLELLPDLAQKAGLEMIPAADGLEAASQTAEPLAAGLTCCELAVAQAGGLVQLAGERGGRLLSLLPPMHVTLVHASAVLPDMIALAAALCDTGRFPQGPPALALISGPSKTADIEGAMVRGVHGPGRVEVILWS